MERREGEDGLKAPSGAGGGTLPVACKVARSPARAERAVLGVLPKGALSSRKILWP